jgi:hypothetical protein
LALAIAAYGELRRVTPERSPVEATRAAGRLQRSVGNEKRTAAAVSYDKAFDRRMIVDRARWTFDGTTTLDLAVVNPTPDAPFSKTAKECLADHGGGKAAPVVQCYVFGSKEAFDAFNHTPVTRDQPGVTADMIPLTTECWVIYAKRDAKGVVTVSDMRLAPEMWNNRGCPKSWRGR